MTHHAQVRMKERMPLEFTLPEVNTDIRLLSARDTLHNKNLRLMLVRGGVVICKKAGDSLIVLTMFSNTKFARFQQRIKSRFIPFASECFTIDGIQVTQNAT